MFLCLCSCVSSSVTWGGRTEDQMTPRVFLMHSSSPFTPPQVLPGTAVCLGLLSISLGIFHHLSYQEIKSLSNLYHFIGETWTESNPCLVWYHLMTSSLTCHLTEMSRCSVDDSGAIMRMEHTRAAGLSTRPGPMGPNVSLERQVTPQPLLLYWGRLGKILAGHSSLLWECKSAQCALACIVLFWGKRFSFTMENCENTALLWNIDMRDMAITIASILRYTSSHENSNVLFNLWIHFMWDSVSFSSFCLFWAWQWKSLIKFMKHLKIKEMQKYSKLIVFTTEMPSFHQLAFVPFRSDYVPWGISKSKYSELVIMVPTYLLVTNQNLFAWSNDNNVPCT